MFTEIHHKLPHVQIGVHLHAKPNEWLEKIQAAYEHGCRRFDAALGGFGGCPMAKDDLVGNIPSEEAFAWLSTQQSSELKPNINWAQLKHQAFEVYAGNDN